MARDLQSLQKQYNSSASAMPGQGPGGHGPRGGGGPGGPRAMGAKGKPKNTKQTVLRLFSYVKPYIFRLILVLVFMLLHTLTSLVGSYLLNPIINKIAGRATTSEAGFLAVAADKIIAGVGNTLENFVANTIGIEANLEIIAYLVAGLVIMFGIYRNCRVLLNMYTSNFIYRQIHNCICHFFTSVSKFHLMFFTR